jgi:hypothetical protein
MRASVFVLIILVAVTSAASAKPPAKKGGAKDTTPPSVEHTPLSKHDGKGPIVVEAHITDDKSGVFEPTLLVRAAGSAKAPAGAFERVPMTPKDGAADVYTAVVPPELLAGDVEYLVEAFDKDGNGPSRVGDEGTPLKIVRDVPAVIAPPPTTTTPPPSTAADPGPSPALIGVGVAAGVVVLVGVVVGGGFAFYALRPPAPEQVAIKVNAPSPVAAQ